MVFVTSLTPLIALRSSVFLFLVKHVHLVILLSESVTGVADEIQLVQNVSLVLRSHESQLRIHDLHESADVSVAPSSLINPDETHAVHLIALA